MGAPMVPGPAVDLVLLSKANDLERAIRRLSILHTHDALVLLRNSLSVPKLIYSMRTSVCADCPSLFRCLTHWGVHKYASISGYMRDTLHWLPIRQRIFNRVAVRAGMALSYRLCPSLLAGTLSPCVVPLLVANSLFPVSTP